MKASVTELLREFERRLAAIEALIQAAQKPKVEHEAKPKSEKK